MRTEIDVQRSLQRYVALLLPTYEVRALVEQGTIGERPYATIAETTGGAAVVSGNLSVRDVTQGFTITAFPKPAPNKNPYTSRILAGEVQEALWRGFQIGGVGGSRQLRVPLYDYDGIAEDQPSSARTPKDYIRITDYDGHAVQSPTDELLYSVVVDLRCKWSRATRLAETEPVVERVVLDIGLQPGERAVDYTRFGITGD